MPKGCPFAPRCEAAMKICLKEKPVRMLINDDHMATCWMNVKKGVEDGSITRGRRSALCLKRRCTSRCWKSRDLKEYFDDQHGLLPYQAR